MRRAPRATESVRIGAYVGAGAGLTTFFLFGLLPASFVGGVAGLHLANSLMGIPVQGHILSRFFVAVFMAVSVLGGASFSAILGITAGKTLGGVLAGLTGSHRQRQWPVERKHSRVPARGELELVFGEKRFTVQQRDISDGGIGVSLPAGFATYVKPGETLSLCAESGPERYLKLIWENNGAAGLAFLPALSP